MKLFTKKVFKKCVLFASIFLIFSCANGVNSNSSNKDGNPEKQDEQQQDEKQDSGEKTITEDPESYGESTLPDLAKSSPFAGKSYCNNDKGEGLFFLENNTMILKEADGSWSKWEDTVSSFRQWNKEKLFSYSYSFCSCCIHDYFRMIFVS